MSETLNGKNCGVTKTNTGKVYHDESAQHLLIEAQAEFTVFGEDCLLMTKKTDREDEHYFPGDTITFTITIKNLGSKKLLNLVFRDHLDDIIEPISGTEFIVTTTIGTIVSKTRDIEITHITLEQDQECIITIKGKIA